MAENCAIRRADVNKLDDDGRTPLFRFLTTKCLIQHGASANHDAFIRLLCNMITGRIPHIENACDVLEFVIQAGLLSKLSPAVLTLIEIYNTNQAAMELTRPSSLLDITSVVGRTPNYTFRNRKI